MQYKMAYEVSGDNTRRLHGSFFNFTNCIFDAPIALRIRITCGIILDGL